MTSSGTPNRLCYVAGANHGGSTMLAMLLDQHPRVVAMGEAGPIRKVRKNRSYDCSCGDPLDRCAFYAAVGARLDQRSIPFDAMDWRLRYETPYPTLDRLAFGLAPARGATLSRARHAALRRLPVVRDVLADVDRRNLAFADAALEVAGADVLVDATKDPERVRLLADLPLTLVVVHLVRDPRAVAFSGSRRGRDPGMIADYWRRTHDALDAMESHLGCRGWITLRYEDVCADPDATLRPVFQLLGLEPFTVAGRVNGSGHHIVGNTMRRGQGQAVRPDDEWRTTMPAADRDAVWERTKATAGRHGYQR